MDHKAHLFDYASFRAKLQPTLERALVSGDCAGLILFIEENFDDLTDPYEGAPLGDGWMKMIESPDAHQYGDFALTRFYDVQAECGLGPAWADVQDALAATDLAQSPVLGHTIGPPGTPFDPGKMGSYFQTAVEVAASKTAIMQLLPLSKLRSVAVEMLDTALNTGSGLYITF